MARFIYGMQNILDIKYKLEDSARQEYADARQALYAEEEKLQVLYNRKELYYKEYQSAISGNLDFRYIEECGNAMDIMDMKIEEQNEVIKKKSKELELVRQKLNQVMQERKMHEKLKEKKFDEFKLELSLSENKETDEVVSYKFNNKSEEEI